jgi:integrase
MKKSKYTRGSVTHVGPNRYRARLMVDGERLSRTFLHEHDARRWIDQKLDALKSGRFAFQRLAESVTLREALERYAREVSPRKKTASADIGAIKRLLHSLGPLADRPMGMIHTSDISGYVRQRLTTPSQRAGTSTHRRRSTMLTPSSVNRELALISHCYSVAQSAWGMEELRNPIIRGVRLKENAGRNRRLEGDEERRLLEAALKHDASPHASVFMRPVIKFALSSAMRLSEIAAMEWRHVDLERGSVFLPVTKNERARTVPLSPSTIKMLSELPRRPNGLVFHTKSAINTAWKKVRDAAGIFDLRFHDLRHEAVSRLFEETNLSESEIATISGHLSPVMLRRYTHLRVGPIVKKLAEAEAGRKTRLD